MRFSETPDDFGLAGFDTLVDAWSPTPAQLFDRPIPLSTMTWTLEILSAPDGTPESLWWYDALTVCVHDGYGHTEARVFDEAGRLVAVSRQTVAIFGCSPATVGSPPRALPCRALPRRVLTRLLPPRPRPRGAGVHAWERLDDVLMLRVQLPDKPGSLGSVATAMGAVGADIMAIEIVEKIDGGVIDDFMVSLPPGMLPDSLVSACAELDGVRVLYLSRHQETWGLEGDIETLNRMLADPGHAAELLTQSAPTVFHAQWAALVDGPGRRVLTSTELAPEFDAEALQRVAPFDMPHRIELPAEWLDAWPATTIAVAPLDTTRAIVLGRQGGPEFLDSELRRLAHLASMAH